MGMDMDTGTGKYEHGPDHRNWKTWAWTWPLVLEKHGHGPEFVFLSVYVAPELIPWNEFRQPM
jgi:hypothetical protein